MGTHQSVATEGKGLLGNEKVLFNLQLLHFDLVTYQEGGKKIDLGIREKSCVHHQEIQFPGCKWKISPTARAAGLSLAGVTESQHG